MPYFSPQFRARRKMFRFLPRSRLVVQCGGECVKKKFWARTDRDARGGVQKNSGFRGDERKRRRAAILVDKFWNCHQDMRLAAWEFFVETADRRPASFDGCDKARSLREIRRRARGERWRALRRRARDVSGRRKAGGSPPTVGAAGRGHRGERFRAAAHW